MKASRNHVRIGDDEFLLDESIDASSNAVGGSLFRPHYKHSFQNVFEGRTPILTGDPNADEVRPERLVWSFSDWTGGEGNRTFANEVPNVYDYSQGVNTRIRGQLTGRPSRTLQTLTTEEVSHYGGFTIGQNALWLGQDRRMHYTTDGTSWTTKTLAQVFFDGGGDLSTNYYITSLSGNDKYAFYSAYNDSSGKRTVRAIQQSGASSSVIDEVSADNPFKGMCIMHGQLYGWTGAALFQLDIFASWPLTLNGNPGYRNVSGNATNTSAFTGSHWADCVAAENAVYMFSSTHGQSQVYQFKYGSGFSPLWVGPDGFTIKSMVYENGTLFFAGHWGGDSSAGTGHGALYAYQLDSHEPQFLGWFRRQNGKNLQMQEMSTSYGSQILVTAAWTGRIFVYDGDTDGITMLDDIATGSDTEDGDSAPYSPNTDGETFTSDGTHKILGVKTYGQYRYVAVYKPGSSGSGSLQLLTYSDDEPGNRQTSNRRTVAGTPTDFDAATTLVTGDNDFGLAFERKILLGFEVLFKPLSTGQSFKLEYKCDGESNWHSAGTLANGDTDASKGRTYIAVSDRTSTVKYARFRWRITVTGTRVSGTEYAPPLIYNVTAESNLIQYDETWDLILRLKDEAPLTRPSTHQYRGSNARSRLFTAKTQQKVLVFHDGYRFRFIPGPPQYTTHSVIIDSIEDIVTLQGEGACKIRLRAVPS